MTNPSLPLTLLTLERPKDEGAYPSSPAPGYRRWLTPIVVAVDADGAVELVYELADRTDHRLFFAPDEVLALYRALGKAVELGASDAIFWLRRGKSRPEY